MNEIPDNLKTALEQYAEQNKALNEDQEIRKFDNAKLELERKLSELDSQIVEASKSYLHRIVELEDYIAAQVMEIGSSVNHAGVEAKHVSGYTRTTWQGKVIEKILIDNPALISTFKPARKETEVKPRVNVIYHGPQEETEEVKSVQFSREDYEAKKLAFTLKEGVDDV